MGLLERTDLFPPPFLLMMVPLTMLTVRTAMSSLGEAVARSTPLWLLVILRGFRLPLEVLMHRSAAEQIMPPQMTWTGLNFDVITGASAIMLGGFLFLSAMRDGAYRNLVLWWCVMGLALLLAMWSLSRFPQCQHLPCSDPRTQTGGSPKSRSYGFQAFSWKQRSFCTS